MTAAPVDLVLSAFEAAGFPPHREGKGWRVACPICGTKSRKGSINIAPNGSVWLHFFCGHPKDEALAAVGLSMSDLFERRDLRALTREESALFREHLRQTRWRAATAAVTPEIWAVLLAAIQLADGVPLNDDDMLRVRVACVRILDAHEVLSHD